MSLSHIIYYVIAALSLVNFARIAVLLLFSDIYDIQQSNKRKHRPKSPYEPLISIIIPAYNEEVGVIRTLESVLENSYRNKQIIVVNDGSTDNTLNVLRSYQRKNRNTFTIVNQNNSGKAAAINRAVKRWARGKLVMVLDADSLVKQDAISNMVTHFRERKVIASAANVKIIRSWRPLGVIQRFEYLIGYRMRRAYTSLNMEYIIGGVGSTFRRSFLLRVGLFDTDTVTEDIDLTVKLIHEFGNRDHKIHYAADAVTYTEHVLKFKSLIRQRLRWKYGRFQVFIKHRELIFNSSHKHNKQLTWYQLPYAIFSEMMMLLEPLLVGFIFYVIVRYSDLTSLISVYLIITSFVFINLLGEDTESFGEKVRLCLLLPAVYVLLYVVSAVELTALIVCIFRAKQLLKPYDSHVTWKHVERSGKQVSI